MRISEARERIAALRHLNAFICCTEEMGEGPVVAVKDVIDMQGMVTTCGVALPRLPAQRDAPIVGRVRRAGGVIVGKTNLHPWAFGVTSANPYWGDVRNPADPERIPGGSSGGSAAAVAARMCDWALGTDTGGSVRIPAALCGVVGFKPTYGLVDTSGVAPLAPSLDSVGVLAPDVYSAARAFEIVTGCAGYVPDGSLALKAVRIGTPIDWVDELDAATEAAWRTVSHIATPIAFPDRRSLAQLGMTLLLAEAATVHATRLLQHPSAYDAEMRRALGRGREILAVDYLDAVDRRKAARREAAEAMAEYDVLVLPTVTRIASRVGDRVRDRDFTRYTLPFNVTGQPAISLPIPDQLLPVGIQLVGRPGADALVLAVAMALEGERMGPR